MELSIWRLRLEDAEIEASLGNLVSLRPGQTELHSKTLSLNK
jgi:hypothetical protein